MGETDDRTYVNLSALTELDTNTQPELSTPYSLLQDGVNKVLDLFKDGHVQIQSRDIQSFLAFTKISDGLEGGNPDPQLVVYGSQGLFFLKEIHRLLYEQRHKMLVEFVFDDLKRILQSLQIDTGDAIIRRGDLVKSKVGDLLKKNF